MEKKGGEEEKIQHCLWIRVVLRASIPSIGVARENVDFGITKACQGRTQNGCDFVGDVQRHFTNVFAVRRDRILQHPLGLYQEFQRQLERGGKQSEVAHYMERVFRSLFNQEWPPASQPRHSSSASHGSRRSRAKSRKSHQ